MNNPVYSAESQSPGGFPRAILHLQVLLGQSIKHHHQILLCMQAHPSCTGIFHLTPQRERADVQATAMMPFCQMSLKFYFHIPDPATKVKPGVPETPEQAAGPSCGELRFLCSAQPQDMALYIND